MRRSPRNVRIAFDDAGLTHYGGVFFFHEFTRVLQLRRSLTRHLQYPRRNQRYELSQMLLALIYPIILGLDRLETAGLLRANGTFQYLTACPTIPIPRACAIFSWKLHQGFANNSIASMTGCWGGSSTCPNIARV